MNMFQFGKQRAKNKVTKSSESKLSSSSNSFMLEPILTPTSGIDGGDGAPDLAVFRADDHGLNSHNLADAPPVSNDGSDYFNHHLSIDHSGDTVTSVSIANHTNLTTDLAMSHLPDIADFTSPDSQFESGFFTVGDTGQVSVDFVFDGGAYQGQLAIFSLDGMEHFQPGSEAFIREAAHRALSHSDLGHIVIDDASDAARFSGALGYEGDFNSGEYQGVRTFAMRPGDRIGFMLVPNGTVQQVVDNPAIDGSHRPLFSMATANPDDGFQSGQIADVNGDGHTFVFEDLRVDGHSDRDYNDVIFQLKGATGHAVNLDDVIDTNHDWRSTDFGQAILSYAIPDSNEHHFDFDTPQAHQPFIGVIDTGFSAHNPDINYSHITLGHDWVDGDDNPLLQPGEGNDHGTHILGIIGATQDNSIGINGINDQAPLWAGRAVGSGHWADSLVEFVDTAKASGHQNAVVNLSLDLTQINLDGSITTRYEFTPAEHAALEYAHQNHVLIVTAAGNDGGTMSILGQASQEFDNIITVGAADGAHRADYSSYGDGLDLLAAGGTAENPILSTVGDGMGTMTGTSVATAEVTGAISQVWAANPDLSYRQIIEILKATATDLDAPGWDLETGAGLLNVMAAVGLAKVTSPQDYTSPALDALETWSGEGFVIPFERAASTFDQLIQGGVTAISADELERLNQIKPIILDIARRYNILPEIIAGIISRETHTRNVIGDGGHGYGYMQLDDRTFLNISSQPWQDPAWNIEQGVKLLLNDKFSYIKSRLPESLWLRGSIAAHNSGQGNVVKAYRNGLDVDAYTTNKNYSADVLNRARWLAQNGWSGNLTPLPTPPSNNPRRPYVVRSGDTLWGIAQRELGDGNRWREIQRVDGSTFTAAEARTLQIGQTIYLPVKYTVGPGVHVTPPPVTSPTPVSIGSLSRSPDLFRAAYERAGGATRGWTPTGHAYRWGNGWTQEFRDATGDRMLLMLEDGADTAYIMWGGNLIEYEFLGGPVGRDLDGRRVLLGYPMSDENIFTNPSDGKRSVWQKFAAEDGKARIHNLYGFASVATWGAIGALYTDMGGAGSFLGMPTRREYIDGDTTFADFQGGRIAYQSSSGKTEALHPGEQPSWRLQQFFEEPVSGSEWRTSVFTWSGNQPPANFWENSNNLLAVINLGSNTRSDGKKGLNSQDWGTGSPRGDRLPSDAFVMRSYTQTHFEAGKTYKARVRADDGYQLLAKKWDTNQWVYFTPKDQWMTDAYGAYKEIEFQVPETGWYDFHFHYYEAGVNAYFDLAWEEVSSANQHVMTYQEFVNNWKQWAEYTTRNPFPAQGANCTWYAHGRMMQLGYSEYALDSMLGNAGTWDNTAGRGAKVVSQPQVPCIAVWEANVGGAGSVGHVAVVERINSDGSILISESNWPTGNTYGTRTIYPGNKWPSKFITVPKA